MYKDCLTAESNTRQVWIAILSLEGHEARVNLFLPFCH